MTKRTRLILWVLATVVVIVAVAGYQMVRWAESPVATDADKPPSKIVIIPEGSTFQQVASLLAREHLIKSRAAFLMLGKANTADRKIQPGEYELNPAMLPVDILNKLLAGKVVLHSVTVPEGFTMAQIAEVVGQQGITDPAEFLRLAKDKIFLRSLGIQADSLEGYLFPDTYRLARPTKSKEVIQMMVNNLWQAFTPDLRDRAKDLNMTVHDVLTLASVVEKETRVGTERQLISAVFHNRLKKRIPLQSDPTVIYGLPSFDGNLRKKDLSNSSPYNTYRVKGLPPGPIASPGAQAIRAVLYPTPSPYLYFVSRNDGTHQFSATLTEHNLAVEKYQRRPFRKSGRKHILASGA